MGRRGPSHHRLTGRLRVRRARRALGLDGREINSVRPPKPPRVREHPTANRAVVTETNRVVAEVTNPALAELDADRLLCLLVTGEAGSPPEDGPARRQPA